MTKPTITSMTRALERATKTIRKQTAAMEDKDVQIAALKEQVEMLERIACREHTEMASQDHIHADELEQIKALLIEIRDAIKGK